MEPLSIDEILDETNQCDITARQRHWLISEVSFSFYGTCRLLYQCNLILMIEIKVFLW